MLNNVAESVSFSTRQVVLRHPNSMPCTVWRKTLTRTETDPITGAPTTMGGSPTLGGMGVLVAEDEAEFTYVELGTGRMMFSGPYQPSDMVERDDALLQAPMQEALVEATANPGTDGYFLPEKYDLVIVEPGLGTALAYSVENIIGSLAIPPYTRKLVLNPRDDLHALEPFLSE